MSVLVKEISKKSFLQRNINQYENIGEGEREKDIERVSE